MRRITRNDAIKAFGGADDIAIAQIIGTGATIHELAEAQAWLANNEPLNRPAAARRARWRTRRDPHQP
jgi:hypothetical protein